MAQVINTNTMSLNAQRNLGTSGANLATTIQRLSSGMRINSAKDDAAGLAISERFTTQIRGANQAARNANDGISLAQTAEGALGEIGNNLQRVRELAVQSRSATNSDSDRQALNAEVQLLKQEIQRVAEQTNFNGTNLLDGTFTNQAFQIGANQGQTINISQVANANISKLGNWTTASKAATATGAVPVGGAKDAVANATAGTIDGASLVDATGADGARTYDAFSFNVSGVKIDVAGVTGGADVAAARASMVTNIGNALAAKSSELAAAGVSTSVASGAITISNSGEAFKITGAPFVAAGVDVAVATQVAKAADFSTGVAAGELQISKSDGSGFVDITVGASKTAGDRSTALVNAINAKTHETGVTASLVEGKLQLTSEKADFEVKSSLTADKLKDATGLATGTAKFTAGKAAEGFADLDISSKDGADNAILAMDAALNSINSARADLGAIQNRFTSVVANLNTSSENMSAARSRIRDVDYASETAELTRNQILQQAGTAMLAQANQSSQNVLSLLR
ncbi:TPA: flagellin [Stenotrophomonas maltophilia]|nr:flagellin [Stenotrophomonas maltophilia]ASE51869.1 flagellin [Stenotrophomonas maltophilia]HDX0899748.1 flagellin [Stenotrophomonas maltophilia]HDX0917160.1 flagellin [Stenotrophomonas maltophilia]HEL4829778.1 flagellin [Stenotrophomonas maltophilia]HEL5083497.1 flagellin [Stenotrophomonas maltophilia]